MSDLIWDYVLVDWNPEWKCWSVGLYDFDGNRENFAEYSHKVDAIEEAHGLAFLCVAGTTPRSQEVRIETKAGKLVKTITQEAA